MIKCEHQYEATVMPLGHWVLGIPYMFTCRKCMKHFYGNKRTANRLKRKGLDYSYEREWNKKMDAFQKDPSMNMQPPMIILPDKMEKEFWPS